MDMVVEEILLKLGATRICTTAAKVLLLMVMIQNRSSFKKNINILRRFEGADKTPPILRYSVGKMADHSIWFHLSREGEKFDRIVGCMKHKGFFTLPLLSLN